MERVRPGVELVLAILAPRSELMTLDLPTFDRPRNATSGSTGAGNWLASLTDIMNRVKTRIKQFAVSPRKLQADGFLCVLCGEKLLTAKVAKDAAKGAKEALGQ